MADNKKYYWLKLKEDFFRNKEIKKLRRIAGGDTYTIIYLKMQLLSLKNEGKIYFDGIETTFPEELALELDENPEDVKLTVAFLLANSLLEQVENDEFYLNKVPETIGKETAAAERMRRIRQNKNVTMFAPVTKCYTEIDIEKELELELELDQEPEKEKPLKKGAKSKNKENLDLYREQIERSALLEVTKEKMQEWLTYKGERKDYYAQTGFNSLLTQITKKEAAKGFKYVLSSIDNSMANNWKGIIWDKETAEKPQPKDWMDIEF